MEKSHWQRRASTLTAGCMVGLEELAPLADVGLEELFDLHAALLERVVGRQAEDAHVL